MSTWHAQFSSAPSFHPEFGYLCPSPSFLRRVRHAAVMITVGLVVVGGTALALVPQFSQRDVVREEGMRAGVGLLPDTSASAAQPSNNISAPPAALAFASRGDAASQTACDDLADAFLTPPCRFGKGGRAHPAHTARAQGAQVPTVALGRTDTRPQSPASAPVREAVAVAPPVEAASPVVLPPERPALPPKKPVKVVHKPAPSNHEIAVAEAPPPPAPSPGFDLLGLFRGLPGNGSGAWAMQR